MSIQEWAAFAEIIGAVAVVASLIYLAVQIRQNTHQISLSLKSMELAAFERNVESGIRIRELFILNPEILELYARGGESYAHLDEDEKLRFDMILRNVFSAIAAIAELLAALGVIGSLVYLADQVFNQLAPSRQIHETLNTQKI